MVKETASGFMEKTKLNVQVGLFTQPLYRQTPLFIQATRILVIKRILEYQCLLISITFITLDNGKRSSLKF